MNWPSGLARVPKELICDRDAHGFSLRVEPNGGNIVWSHDIADRGPVFSNLGAVSDRSDVTYRSVLRGYLLTMIGPDSDSRLAGGLGVYNTLPNHVGPWTMAFYTRTLARSGESWWII